MAMRNLIDIDNHYFVIDSTKLDNIQTKLYGVVYSDRGIFTNKQLNLLKQSDFNNQDGTYVYIEKNKNKIIIKQDWHGKYGLYLYKHNKDFYISNSFYYLVNYLAKHKLPFNTNLDYVKYMYVVGMCSEIHKQTLVNEITLLPRNCYLEIDIKSKKLKVTKFEQKRRFIELDSKQAIGIIDKWFYKWKHFLENLAAKGVIITDEISGGIDSRITYMLFDKANIDRNNIRYFSLTKNRQKDFKHASAVAKACNFVLNKRSYFNYNLLSIGDTINLHTYTKLFFHNYNSSVIKTNIMLEYIFDGFFGENLRGFYPSDMTEKSYLDAITERACKFGKDFVKSALSMAKDSINSIKKQYSPKDDRELFIELYEESRSRHHFGLWSSERLLTNRIQISPLAEKTMSYLKHYNNNCDDSLLLATLLFTRFCPKLLKYPFTGIKKLEITDKLRAEASRINKKYPLKVRNIKVDKNFIIPIDEPVNSYDMKLSSRKSTPLMEYEDVLNAIYNCSYTKQLICNNLGKDVYKHIKIPIDQHKSIYSLLPLISFSLIEMTKVAAKDHNYYPEDYYSIMLQLDKKDPI